MTSRGPEFPHEPPENGEVVLIRYHSRRGCDGYTDGRVVDTEGAPGAYTLTVDGWPAQTVADVQLLGVRTTWHPDDDDGKRLGVLKAIRPLPDGEVPEVDKQVSRFSSISSMVCPECDHGAAVVESERPACAKCGAELDMDAVSERRDAVADASRRDENPPSPSELEAGPNELFSHRVGLDPAPGGMDYVCLDCGARARTSRRFRSKTCLNHQID